MPGELTLREQQEALVARIKDNVPNLAGVIDLEELDDALDTDEMLPAAIVIFSGDYPEKEGHNLLAYRGQKVNRYWSVIVVIEIADGPGDGLDLLEAVRNAGIGWSPCRGVKPLAASGSRFVSKFDNTRVVYEVRFVTLTTL